MRVLVNDRNFPVAVAVGDSAYCISDGQICTVHNAENDANAVDPSHWPDMPDIPGSIDEWWNSKPDDDSGSGLDDWWNSLFPSGDNTDPSVTPAP